ncbi:MAG: DNA alkylation repair protein [Bacilli bacterium]|nr:DNA alkylation repair protein [Bacilli bacterium]
MKIQKILNKYADKKYAIFQAKLTPTVDSKLFIGVRVPDVRKIAKTYINDPEHIKFMKELPHHYYDENMLHGLLISEIKDYEECIKEVNHFLPYVDNWAVCDIMSPKVFRKHKEELISEIKKWCKSKKTYTIRFGIEMLMSHYLDDDFKKEYLKIPACVKNDKYYVKMMIAWFYATALAKRYDATIPYLKKKTLSTWVHNKTIQKACESYRITDKQKQYLKTLKVKE